MRKYSVQILLYTVGNHIFIFLLLNIHILNKYAKVYFVLMNRMYWLYDLNCYLYKKTNVLDKPVLYKNQYKYDPSDSKFTLEVTDIGNNKPQNHYYNLIFHCSVHFCTNIQFVFGRATCICCRKCMLS